MNTFTVTSAVDYSTGIANIGKCAIEEIITLKQANKKDREGDKMKLFEVNILYDCYNNSYLMVGKDDDTEESIKNKVRRSYEENEDIDYYVFIVSEITEVDGHKIRVEE